MKFTFWCREQKTNTKASVRQVVMGSVEEDKGEPWERGCWVGVLSEWCHCSDIEAGGEEGSGRRPPDGNLGTSALFWAIWKATRVLSIAETDAGEVD